MSRLIRTIVARKRVLLITGLWLAAGTTAGYFLGAAENKKGLDAVTVNNTDIRNVGESVFLVYTCNNQEFERYDIDRTHLIDGQDNLYGPTEGLFQKTYSRAFEVLGGSGLTQALHMQSRSPDRLGCRSGSASDILSPELFLRLRESTSGTGLVAGTCLLVTMPKFCRPSGKKPSGSRSSGGSRRIFGRKPTILPI